MNSQHLARIVKLSEEIDDVLEFLAYWRAVTDPEQLEEAPGRIAMLETDLASLKMEYKSFTDDIKAQP